MVTFPLTHVVIILRIIATLHFIYAASFSCSAVHTESASVFQAYQSNNFVQQETAARWLPVAMQSKFT